MWGRIMLLGSESSPLRTGESASNPGGDHWVSLEIREVCCRKPDLRLRRRQWSSFQGGLPPVLGSYY